MGLFRYVTGRQLCPICGGSTDCRINAAGGVHCRRGSPDSPPAGWRFSRTDQHGFNVFWSESDTGKTERPASILTAPVEAAHRPARKTGKSLSRFEFIESNKIALPDDYRSLLSNILGISIPAFPALNVELLRDDGMGQSAFVFPERDGAGVIVAWNLRYIDGKKRTHGGDEHPDGNRGLFIPDLSYAAPYLRADWPIIVPEGASDTLALLSMGFHAVGRPSNTGGVAHLVAYLQRQNVPIDRPIIILGENDKKVGGEWPGREGAIATAEKVAKALGRKIEVAYPAVGFKDVREYLNSFRREMQAKTITLDDLGRQFIASIQHGETFGSDCQSAATSILGTPAPGRLFGKYERLMEDILDGFNMPISENRLMQEAEPTIVDAMAAPVSCECISRRGVVMANYADGQARLCWFDCRKLDCPKCGPIKRDHYKATVEHHANNYFKVHQEADGGRLYLWWTDETQWKKESEKIRRRDGDFFRLDLDGRLLVISTENVSDSAHVHEVGQLEAVERLSTAIDQLPKLRAKVFTASKRWKLLPNGDVSSGKSWERIASFDADRATASRILTYHEVGWKIVSSGGRWWSWCGFQFPIYDINLQDLKSQLDVGEPMEMDIHFSSSASAGGAVNDDDPFTPRELANASGTDPGGGQVDYGASPRMREEMCIVW